MMKTAPAAYQCGRLVSEIEQRFYEPSDMIHPSHLTIMAGRPSLIPQMLQRVWGEAMAVPEIADILNELGGVEGIPSGLLGPLKQNGFWLGYSHQKASRRIEPADFSEKLRQERESRSLTVVQVAEMLGVSRQHVYDLERGKTKPSWHLVQLLADSFGTTLEFWR